MTRTIKLTVQYDGTEYSGWQRQLNARTVQELLETALAKMTGATTHVQGSGRTDSGVHARAQVATFRTEATIALAGFQRGLNTALPRDIGIVAIAEVEAGFDARRAARGKHYCYRIWTAEAREPLLDRFVWHLGRPLDTVAMQAAATHLVGEHDFTTFRTADCDRKNPVRSIRRLDVTAGEGGLVTVDAFATAFLKHMVRIVVGTLVEVGLGRRGADDLPRALAARNRSEAGRTAPAKGLTLERVFYET